MADAVPAKIKRSLWRGDHRQWTHEFRDPSGELIPFAEGTTFLAQFRNDLDRGTLVCSSVCEITDTGTVVETLTSDEADLLPGQTNTETKPVVYWDLQMIDPDGERHTYLYANCTVMGDRSNV